jgi:biotin-(acetyl-CoA carboxylase) ligase
MLQAVSLEPTTNVFHKACSQAMIGCDSGLVLHARPPGELHAAIVLAPEVSLEQSMSALVACAIGLQNALGALAPPEVAVQLTWDGVVLINGARCGHLKVSADAVEPNKMPRWMVIGMQMPFNPAEEDPGYAPDETCLFNEGCIDIEQTHLLEAWARHSVLWIQRWLDAGPAILHREWIGLLSGVGETMEVDGLQGVFMGVDEHFGPLLRIGETTHSIPLSSLIRRG